MKYIIVASVMIVVFLAFENYTIADDAIRHPVDCYTIPKAKCHGCPKDSVLVGRMTFDPLPEYMKPSKLTVEYYCDVDEDSDIIFRVSEYDKTFLLSEYEKTCPGPIHIGDTIRAEFIFTPIKDGVLLPIFKACQPKTYYFEDTIMHVEAYRARLAAPFALGPDGTLIAMNSPAMQHAGNPFGPLPEIMPDSLLFYEMAKMPDKFLGRHGIHNRDQQGFFAIETVLFTKPDDSGYHHIKCHVSPYHHFEAGIAIRIIASEGVIVKNISDAWRSAVGPEDTITFAFDFKITEPGISDVTITFMTFNPDKGNRTGIGHGAEKLKNHQRLYFGHNDNLELVYLTTKFPGYTFGNRTRSGEWVPVKDLYILRARDPRVSWLENLPVDQKGKKTKTYTSAGHFEVMNFDRLDEIEERRKKMYKQ